jgi:hypothetical protein
MPTGCLLLLLFSHSLRRSLSLTHAAAHTRALRPCPAPAPPCPAPVPAPCPRRAPVVLAPCPRPPATRRVVPRARARRAPRPPCPVSRRCAPHRAPRPPPPCPRRRAPCSPPPCPSPSPLAVPPTPTPRDTTAAGGRLLARRHRRPATPRVPSSPHARYKLFMRQFLFIID